MKSTLDCPFLFKILIHIGRTRWCVKGRHNPLCPLSLSLSLHPGSPSDYGRRVFFFLQVKVTVTAHKDTMRIFLTMCQSAWSRFLWEQRAPKKTAAAKPAAPWTAAGVWVFSGGVCHSWRRHRLACGLGAAEKIKRGWEQAPTMRKPGSCA